MVSPEAGWYADPTDPSAVRWWDGAAWSAQTRPAPRELALAGAAVGGSSASVGASAAHAPAAPVPAAPVQSAPTPDAVTVAATVSAPESALPAVVTIGADPEPAPAAAPAAAAATPAPAAVVAPPVPTPPAAAHETAVPEAAAAIDRSRPGARPPVAASPEHVAPHVDPVAPEEQAAIDRSRPGARRPATPTQAAPVEVAMPPAAAAPIKPGVTPGSTPSQPSAAWVESNFPATPAGGGGTGFGAAPQRFGGGGGSSPMGAAPKLRRPPMHWKIPVTIGVVLALVVGAAAAVGVPRYLASKAQAQAALAPSVLTHTAPKTLSGQRKVALPGMNATALGQQLTGAGAAWAWAQAYGTRDAFTLYVASDVPVADRADAVRALTSHDAAASLIGQVSAGLTAGSSSHVVAGTPVDYSSPVGGKTWCMPLTVSGVAGGYCLWTSGKEFLQVLTMPGIEQVSAKSTLTALKQMAAAVTKTGPTSTLVPKASGK